MMPAVETGPARDRLSVAEVYRAAVLDFRDVMHRHAAPRQAHHRGSFPGVCRERRHIATQEFNPPAPGRPRAWPRVADPDLAISSVPDRRGGTGGVWPAA